MLSSNTEKICTVDENNEVTGSIDINQYYALPENQRPYIRSVGAFIVYRKKTLWVPRRAEHKKVVPGGLDYSVGGHVQAGESYRDAIKREALEEIKWVLKDEYLEEVSVFPATTYMPYFRMLYVYRSDDVPEINPDDYSEALILSPQDLLLRLQNGEVAKKSIREATTFLIQSELDNLA